MHATRATDDVRPKLLFFRWIRAAQPSFLLEQLAEQLACLRLFFDVELVDYACDYDELCDRHQPDIALFESGIYSGPRSVSNADSHPEVPKLGFLNADAFDPVRATFLSDMDRWGVDTFFTVSLSMGEYTPEIADRLFVWPNFVDPKIHRDYGLPKVVPILLTGSQARHYPWRNRVSRVLAQHYPSLATPHFGWIDGIDIQRMWVGEGYARLVNSAKVAPTCGSVTRDLVRKHLEIPASRTCLITERTPAVEAAGYLDMVNCVFADGDDALDRVDHLFRNPDELDAITEAGFALVHARHTARDRRQIRDWFDLFCLNRSADDIVQPDPFGSLQYRGSSSPKSEVVVGGRSEDRVLVSEGWRALSHGHRTAASRAFTRASNYHYMPEAEVGKAFVQLSSGDAAAAQSTIDALLTSTFDTHGSADPDPIQWALHIRALLCRGELKEAYRDSSRYSAVRQPELDRMRWMAARLSGEQTLSPVACRPRATVNPLPDRCWAEWVTDLATMVRGCGQGHLAAVVSRCGSVPEPRDAYTTDNNSTRVRTSGAPVAEARRTSTCRGDAIRDRVQATLRTVRAQPRLLARRSLTAKWLRAVEETAERDEVDVALFAGSSRLSLRERSIRNALARNPRLPDCVAAGLMLSPQQTPVGQSTLVFVGKGARRTPELVRVLGNARIVVAVGLARPAIAGLTEELISSGEVEVIAHSIDRRGGYLILRRNLALRSKQYGHPVENIGE